MVSYLNFSFMALHIMLSSLEPRVNPSRSVPVIRIKVPK